MFTPLTQHEIRKIVKLQLNNLMKQLETGNIILDFSESAIDWLASAGFDPQFGARPIKRAIQKNLLNELSKQIISQKINPGNKIHVDLCDDKLCFNNI